MAQSIRRNNPPALEKNYHSLSRSIDGYDSRPSVWSLASLLRQRTANFVANPRSSRTRSTEDGGSGALQPRTPVIPDILQLGV